MKFDYRTYFRLFFLLLFSVLFVFCFTKAGTFMYKTVIAKETYFNEETTIGPVSINGMSAEKAKAQLEAEISFWKKNSKIYLTYSDEKILVPADKFNFLIEESVKEAKNGVNNSLSVELNEKEILPLVSQITSEEVLNEENIGELVSGIEKQAAVLGTDEAQIKIVDFINPETPLSKQTISSANLQTDLIKDLLEPVSIQIKENGTFSVLKDIAAKFPSFSEENLSAIASALYEASLNTNLHVRERHISQEIPKDIKLGFEADIKKNEKDFILHNPNDFPLQFNFHSSADYSLTVSIIGFPLNKQYEVFLKEKNKEESILHYRTIIQYSYLDSDDFIKQTGRHGEKATVFRDVFSRNGEKEASEMVSEDIYLPVNEIIVKSIMAKATVDELTGETTTENDQIDTNSQQSDVQSQQLEE